MVAIYLQPQVVVVLVHSAVEIALPTTCIQEPRRQPDAIPHVITATAHAQRRDVIVVTATDIEPWLAAGFSEGVS